MSDDQLPAGWAKTTLAEVATWSSGGTPRSGTAEYYGGDIPWAVIGDLTDGEVRITAASVTPLGLEKSSAKIVDEGTVLVAMYGASIGKLGIAGTSMATNQAIASASPSGAVDRRYLMWWLRSQRQELIAAGQGGAQPNISQGILKAWPIVLAPISEQTRIIDELERRLSHVEAAEAGLRSSLRRLLVARDAVLWTLVLPGSDKPAGEDGLIALPPGWEWSTLGEVADVAGGVTKDSKRQRDPAFVEVPYLRVANVQRGRLDLDEVTTIRVSPDKAKALQLQEGDILFNEGGDRDKLGRGWVWEGQIADCIHQNHVFRARLTEPRLEPKFVSFVGNTFGRKWFEAAGKQTTNLASINMTTLKAFPVPLPPAGIATEIVVEAERRLSLINAAEHSVALNLKKAAQLRRSLLSAAFGGRLVPQDPADEPAEVLLARIRTNRAADAQPVAARKPRGKKEQAA